MDLVYKWILNHYWWPWVCSVCSFEIGVSNLRFGVKTWDQAWWESGVPNVASVKSSVPNSIWNENLKPNLVGIRSSPCGLGIKPSLKIKRLICFGLRFHHFRDECHNGIKSHLRVEYHTSTLWCTFQVTGHISHDDFLGLCIRSTIVLRLLDYTQRHSTLPQHIIATVSAYRGAKLANHLFVIDPGRSHASPRL